MEAVLLEPAVGELVKVIKNAVKKTFECQKDCEDLKNKLEGIIPLWKDLFQPGVTLSEDRKKPLLEFQQALQNGEKLVEECSKVNPLCFWESYKYAGKIAALKLYIQEFSTTNGWVITYSELRLMRVSLEAKLDKVELKLENIGVNLEAKVQNVEDRIEHIIEEIFQRFIKGHTDKDKNAFPLSIPELPDFIVGLDISVRELKKRLFCEDVPLIAVVGTGGSGKSTLANAFCNNIEVQGHFTYKSEKRIVFEKVSRSPNIMEILGGMWLQIVPGNSPNFRDIDDARRQLQEKLCPKEPKPTLVVLDDVWGMEHLDQLMFKGCKTLITTRNNHIVTADCRYEKRLLEMSDAVPLFCHWAFGRKSIPETADNTLVREVIAKCNGLPLALQVIGRSLFGGKGHAEWVTAKDKLSQGQTLSDIHEKALSCMATSVDILKPKVRECFLDMGIFPEARKISAELLLDLGVYVHKLPLKEAYTILIELASRNLVKLVNIKEDTQWNFYESISDLSFIQHDIMRELALYLTEKEPIVVNRRKRLIMPQSDQPFRKMWKQHAKSPFDAEIVSFTTGPMQKKDWCQMDFPNAKALILNFSATEYCLPPFMESMKKLKVLIILNNSSKRATLEGISVFSSLTRLKVFRLQRVIVPPSLQVYWQSWRKLKTLSLVLCEGFENMTPLPLELDLNSKHLIEFTIDHCINLKELPDTICQMTFLKRLSVTNCPDLQKLSDDIEKLSSLQRLRLHACPSLTELPNSICKLRKLELLDISLCQGIKQLPDELGQLSSLRKIDMRECSRMWQPPRSACDLSSQVRVICDTKIQNKWSRAIPGLQVEVAEEDFNLDWLQN